jgi:hypothetical protein
LAERLGRIGQPRSQCVRRLAAVSATCAPFARTVNETARSSVMGLRLAALFAEQPPPFARYPRGFAPAAAFLHSGGRVLRRRSVSRIVGE